MKAACSPSSLIVDNGNEEPDVGSVPVVPVETGPERWLSDQRWTRSATSRSLATSTRSATEAAAENGNEGMEFWVWFYKSSGSLIILMRISPGGQNKRDYSACERSRLHL